MAPPQCHQCFGQGVSEEGANKMCNENLNDQLCGYGEVCYAMEFLAPGGMVVVMRNCTQPHTCDIMCQYGKDNMGVVNCEVS